MPCSLILGTVCGGDWDAGSSDVMNSDKSCHAVARVASQTPLNSQCHVTVDPVYMQAKLRLHIHVTIHVQVVRYQYMGFLSVT